MKGDILRGCYCFAFRKLVGFLGSCQLVAVSIIPIAQAVVFKQRPSPRIAVDMALEMLDHFAGLSHFACLVILLGGGRRFKMALDICLQRRRQLDLVKALAKADGQDQLSHGHRHAEFIEHVVVFR